MSMSQRKYRSISADPRLVTERTVSNPGTLLTASSNGRVIVTIIWSIGMTPLSTATSTRGKSVDGNTDTGIVKARYAPRRPNVRMRKITGRECCEIQCWPEFWSFKRPAFGEFTHLLRSSYFSSDPPAGALGASLAPSPGSLDPSAPSAGVGAASILILVLSGSP